MFPRFNDINSNIDMNNFYLTIFLATVSQAALAGKHNSPNIVLIMCDDMGFSDLGCYGSEIKTPNIDKLAQEGVRFSQFKNTGRSCPSRAALLTGRYPHQAGMGWMAEVDEHRPGYRGQIDKEYPTIAEIMKAGGYSTYMSGKWHLTAIGGCDAPNGSYPVQRGFDRYYGCLRGGGDYYKPSPVYNDLEKICDLPDNYYYTNAITDSAVCFVNRHNIENPMFLYVAHYAPHLPLQAPEEYVKKCIDRYEVGYDVLRRQRFERQKKLGLVPSNMELPLFNKEFEDKRPAWEDLSEELQEQWVKDMATYAAMIEIMDEGIGNLVNAIKKKGMYENTVFIFLSDNGATDEGGYIGQLMSDLSNTPYRSYKKWVFQGGTSTPFILSYGDSRKNRMKGQICHQPAHIIDVMPTCMALGNVIYPKNFSHDDLEGKNLLPASEGKNIGKRTLYFEHQGSCAIIEGSWKLVRANRNMLWELIDLDNDPFETMDLASEYPEKVEELEAKWIEWGNTHKVFPLEDKPWTERLDFYKSQNPNQRGE